MLKEMLTKTDFISTYRLKNKNNILRYGLNKVDSYKNDFKT